MDADTENAVKYSIIITVGACILIVMATLSDVFCNERLFCMSKTYLFYIGIFLLTLAKFVIEQ